MLDLTDRAAVNEAVMTVAEFLALVAAGAREANEMVMPLVGWERSTHRVQVGFHAMDESAYEERPCWRRGDELVAHALPYATAGPDHPERWKLWGEMWEALPRGENVVGWSLGQFKDGSPFLVNGYFEGRADLTGPVGAANTPNTAAAVALLLAKGLLKED